MKTTPDQCAGCIQNLKCHRKLCASERETEKKNHDDDVEKETGRMKNETHQQ